MWDRVSHSGRVLYRWHCILRVPSVWHAMKRPVLKWRNWETSQKDIAVSRRLCVGLERGLSVETMQDGQILGLVWGQEQGLTEELWNMNWRTRKTDSTALGLSHGKGRAVTDGDEREIPGAWLVGIWSFHFGHVEFEEDTDMQKSGVGFEYRKMETPYEIKLKVCLYVISASYP